MMEPSTTPIAHLSIPPLPINVPPIRSEANAIVTIPVPISILTDFCDCARRHPASPVNALATQSPTIVVNTGLIEDERTISGLLPVALMASPSLVFKNKVIMATATATTTSTTKRTFCPAKTVPVSISSAIVNIVSVLFILRSEDPPIIAIFTE